MINSVIVRDKIPGNLVGTLDMQDVLLYLSSEFPVEGSAKTMTPKQLEDVRLSGRNLDAALVSEVIGTFIFIILITFIINSLDSEELDQ
jgi:hypothetical protein